MSYDLIKIIFVKIFTMKCHTCHHRVRILNVDWLHKYLSYDWGSKPNKIPTRQTGSGRRTLMDKKKPDVETTGLN